MPVLGSEILNKTGKKIFLWVGFIIEANKIRQIPISSIADGKSLAFPVESHATFSSSFFKTKKPMKILFSAVFLGIKPVNVFSSLSLPSSVCRDTHFWKLAHCDVTKDHWHIIVYLHQVSDEFVSPSEFTLQYFLSSSEGGPRIPAVFCASTAVLVFFWHFPSFHSTSAQPHRTDLAFESSALFLDPIVQPEKDSFCNQ